MPPRAWDGPAIESDESRLLMRARAGDRGAFEVLLTPHLGVARGLAARLVGSLDDAEDTLQDALIKTWTHLGDCRTGGRFRSWFLRIVYHQGLDQRRRAVTRRGHERAAAQPAGAPSPAATGPGARLERRESAARVTRLLAGLPPRQRAALHLRVVDELDYDEIAAVVGLTPGSARVYVARARAALRAALAAGEERA